MGNILSALRQQIVTDRKYEILLSCCFDRAGRAHFIFCTWRKFISESHIFLLLHNNTFNFADDLMIMLLVIALGKAKGHCLQAV